MSSARTERGLLAWFASNHVAANLLMAMLLIGGAALALSIKVEIFPAMSMGGKPGELYSQVRDGTADIVWTLLGYTPGVFPRTEVFELPTVHRGSAALLTLPRIDGRMAPSASMSSWYQPIVSSVIRRVAASRVSSAPLVSTARVMIRSSTSVKLRT